MNTTRVAIAVLFLYIVNRDRFATCRENSDDEITIPQGKLKGSSNKYYRMFLGVPYASVIKRFQAPGPPPVWYGTLEANRGSIMCPQTQPYFLKPSGQEDCLVLNIYTPLSITRPLPVIAFIHGGAFFYGSNTDLLYNPKYLVEKDVIVVNINYRLGAFGFLCLNIKEAPGNAGLRDQIAALQWIHDNIEYFGGDPDKVTMQGESAGASSVNYIMLSQTAEHLYTRAIMESGSVLLSVAFDGHPIRSASFVASKLGYNSTDPKKLLEIFINASMDDIITASYAPEKNDPFRQYIFRPCLDKAAPDVQLIKATPRQLYRSVKLNPNKEVIIGYNNKEGIMWAGAYDFEGLMELSYNLSSIIPDNIIFENDEQRLNLIESIRKFYFQDKPLKNHDSLIDYFSDSVIIYSTAAAAKYTVESNVTVFNYYFEYDSFRNLNKFVSGLPKAPGADHGDELFYIFDPIVTRYLPVKENDKKIINLLTRLWTNFAKTGNPTAYMKNLSWTRSNHDDLLFLNIDNTLKMTTIPNKERIEFWREVYQNYEAY